MRRLAITIITVLFILIASIIMGVLSRYILGAVNLASWFCSCFGWLVTTLLFVYLSYKFLKDAIREIPADPPHKAIPLFLGKRQNKIVGEGWRLFPFYQVLFDAIAIDITKNNEDLPPQEVKTPDLADLKFEVSITWSAGGCWDRPKSEQVKLLNNYIMSKKEPGVKKIYRDVIQSRLRIWTFSEEEGPSSWQEAIGCKDEAIATLVKAILGNNIPSIPSDVPTNVLLRYFSIPRKNPLTYQKQKWGKQTEQGNEWDGLEQQLSHLDENALEELKEAVKNRQEIVRMLREGNGFFVHEKLGITIHLLTINNVSLIGKVEEAVQNRIKEKEERKAEETEIDHVLERIQKLNKDGKIPKELAAELVQTERGKITKQVHETKISLSPELIALLKKVVKLAS